MMVVDIDELLHYLRRPTLLIILFIVILIGAMRIFHLATIDTLILFMYFIGIAASLNIIMGFAGYISFGHAVFLGIGSYIYILSIYFNPNLNMIHHSGLGLGIIIVAILAAAVAAVIASTVGGVVLRLRGAFFAIATIGLDFAVLYFIKATVPSLDPDYFFGAQVILPARLIVDKSSIFNAVFITLIAVLLVNYMIKKSRFGAGLIAIREDEDAAETLGVPTAKYKTLAFALSAFFTAMFGAMISIYGGGVDDHIFHLGKSVDMIVMIIIGGLGTVLGPLVGGIIYYWLYDTLLVHYPGVNLIILGVIVALIILFAPEGVIGMLRKQQIMNIKLKDLLE